MEQVFRLGSTRYDMNFIKNYLIPLLVKKRRCWITCHQNAKQFASIKVDKVQLLHFLNFLRCAKNLDSFLKAYKSLETKEYVHTIGSNNRRFWTKKNFPLGWLSQQTTKLQSSRRKVFWVGRVFCSVWWQSLSWLKRDSLKHHLLEQTTCS